MVEFRLWRRRPFAPSAGSRRFGLCELRHFLGAKRARQSRESQAVRGFERKAVSAARRYVDGDLVVGPIVELRRADIERTALDFAEQNVVTAGAKVARLEAHWRASLAASARQMKDEGPMRGFERANQDGSLGRDNDATGHGGLGRI